MAHDFRLYGGLLSALPSLANREPGYVTDQPRLYVGNTGLGNTLLGVLRKINATTAPTVNDDAGDGYSVGSIWTDTTNDKSYICSDSTVGAAVWQQFSGTGSGTSYSGDETTIHLSGTTFSAILQLSITSDSSGIKLSNDTASPGGLYCYATNSGGTKGWQELAAMLDALGGISL